MHVAKYRRFTKINSPGDRQMITFIQNADRPMQFALLIYNFSFGIFLDFIEHVKLYTMRVLHREREKIASPIF